MLNEFSRTELLLGKDAMQRLYHARVAVFGIGGVGGYVVEALARSGVGAFDLIDDDKVCLTNINRQIIATRQTIGKYKVDVMEERIHLINPEAVSYTHLVEQISPEIYENYRELLDNFRGAVKRMLEPVSYTHLALHLDTEFKEIASKAWST